MSAMLHLNDSPRSNKTGRPLRRVTIDAPCMALYARYLACSWHTTDDRSPPNLSLPPIRAEGATNWMPHPGRPRPVIRMVQTKVYASSLSAVDSLDPTLPKATWCHSRPLGRPPERAPCGFPAFSANRRPSSCQKRF